MPNAVRHVNQIMGGQCLAPAEVDEHVLPSSVACRRSDLLGMKILGMMQYMDLLLLRMEPTEGLQTYQVTASSRQLQADIYSRRRIDFGEREEKGLRRKVTCFPDSFSVAVFDLHPPEGRAEERRPLRALTGGWAGVVGVWGPMRLCVPCGSLLKTVPARQEQKAELDARNRKPKLKDRRRKALPAFRPTP